MSYSINYIYDQCECCGRYECEDFGATYNLASMFVALGVGTPYDWRDDNLSTDEIYKRIILGIEQLNKHYSEYAEYEVSNGWGTRDDMYYLLMNLEQCIREHPGGLFEID